MLSFWQGGFLVVASLLATGCAVPVTTNRKSSLVDYLATQEGAEAQNQKASLQLPLKVGVAFVPPGGTRNTDKGFGTAADAGVFIALDQEHRLAGIIREKFASKPWVLDLKIIPSTYLTAGGGFQDMEKVSRLNRVDILILVSLNQVQFTDPKWYSWTYWTLVGAYTVKGDKNDTSTYVDAAVFHVPSRIMLFRTEGISTLKGSATWAQREAKLRERSMEGLTLATEALCKHLDDSVETFKREVAEGKRPDIQLTDKAGIPFGAPGYDPTRK